VRGAYFVIVTISFAEGVRLVALNWDELTHGPMALNNIPPPTLSIPGLFEFSFIGHVPNYYLVLMAAIIAYVVVARLVYSRVGRAMIALRENEPLATASSRRSRAGGVAAVVRSPGPRKQRTPAQDRLRNEGNSSRGALGRSIVNPFWRGIRRREHDV
jgi:ABC-type branched-subunit amino acid transport system permease subunit